MLHMKQQSSFILGPIENQLEQATKDQVFLLPCRPHFILVSQFTSHKSISTTVASIDAISFLYFRLLRISIDHHVPCWIQMSAMPPRRHVQGSPNAWAWVRLHLLQARTSTTELLPTTWIVCHSLRSDQHFHESNWCTFQLCKLLVLRPFSRRRRSNATGGTPSRQVCSHGPGQRRPRCPNGSDRQ